MLTPDNSTDAFVLIGVRCRTRQNLSETARAVPSTARPNLFSGD